MNLAGRRYLVTGAAGAIGSACVELLIAHGARVAGLDRDRLPDRLSEHGRDRLVFIRHDLTDRAGIDDAVARAEREIGGLDGLVHAAAIALRVQLLDCHPDAWDQIIGLNLTATFTLCQSVVRRLATRGGGTVVGFSSGAGLRPNAGNVPYGASKAGVIGLFRAIAIDCAHLGVRANIVVPGLIDTPLMRAVAGDGADSLAAATMLGRLGQPAEVAEIAAFLLSDVASFMTGACVTVDGGASTAGLRFAQ